jgi:hypothetical protein
MLGIQVDPGRCLRVLLESYIEEGKQEEITKLAQKMEHLTSNDYSWHLDLMVVYFKMQDERMARKHLDKIISAAKKSASHPLPVPIPGPVLKKILKTLHEFYKIDSVINFWRLANTELRTQMTAPVYRSMMEILLKCKDKLAAIEIIHQAIQKAKTGGLKLNHQFCSIVLSGIVAPTIEEG